MLLTMMLMTHAEVLMIADDDDYYYATFTWSEHVTNSEIRKRTGQPFAVRYSTCQMPQAVWSRGSGGQVPGSLPCSQSMHMAQSQELEAASRSSETYLAENDGGRPAFVQPRSCIRVQEGTGQNYLARTHGNSYVTDKPRMMMMICLLSS